ncbi:hypothetical protein [Rosenbergiella epipactidis]|uniref:hypothetical protein n=1 Tax=Rosenbergiella epipactidis TaxID=1544694 RepID=UPI001F4E9C3D|nr:hypothetical protein [Rosenbergiella epipactidis]
MKTITVSGSMTEHAAMLRLKRFLSKEGKTIRRNKANTEAAKNGDRFYIVDEEKGQIIKTASTITAWMREYGAMEEWEYVIGEESVRDIIIKQRPKQ